MSVLLPTIFCRGVLPSFRLFAWAAVILSATVSQSAAQSEVFWDFGSSAGRTKPSTPLPEGVSGGEFSHHKNNGDLALFPPAAASTGYAGASGKCNAGAAARLGALDVASSTYFEVTLAPPPGRSLVVSGLSFAGRSTRTGPKAYAVCMSVDQFSVPVASGELANNGIWALHAPPFAPVSTSGGEPLTLRIYGYGGAGNPMPGTANWRLDDVKLTIELRAPSARLLSPVEPVVLRIHEVQGGGAASTHVGKLVTVRGVVVGTYVGGEDRGGFFLQEESTRVDGDSLTSEGIFIFADGAAENLSVVVGELVEVTGYVTEFSGLTEITRITEARKVGTGRLPAPVELRLPRLSAGDLEAFEGMRVTLRQPLFVTENHNLGVHGTFALSSGAVLEVPTNRVAPGAPALAQAAANALNRIVIDDSSSRRVPEPTPFLFGGTTSADATLRIGDRTTAVTGALVFQYGSWRVQASEPVVFERGNPRPRALSAPEPGVVRVVSANLLNFFNGDGVGGGFPTERGADSEAEFVRQRSHSVAALRALHADIVGVIELENDGFDAKSAMSALVAALNAGAAADDRYAAIDLRGPVGTDDITCGFLYKPARVRPVRKAAVNTEAVFNRPPIAQTWEAVGEQFTVCINHFKSKGSGPASGPEADQRDGQGAWNPTRVAQAKALASWLAEAPTGSRDPDVLIMGDLNAYSKEEPIATLLHAGYENVVEAFEGPGGYSFAFNGEVGHLDHALATRSLQSQVTTAFTWHNNSPEPAWLDYNLEEKTPAHRALNDGATPWRASDHDPVVVDVRLGTPVR